MLYTYAYNKSMCYIMWNIVCISHAINVFFVNLVTLGRVGALQPDSSVLGINIYCNCITFSTIRNKEKIHNVKDVRILTVLESKCFFSCTFGHVESWPLKSSLQPSLLPTQNAIIPRYCALKLNMFSVFLKAKLLLWTQCEVVTGLSTAAVWEPRRSLPSYSEMRRGTLIAL